MNKLIVELVGMGLFYEGIDIGDLPRAERDIACQPVSGELEKDDGDRFSRF